MDIAALVVAVLALVFTVTSFWWLNARRGRIEATQPRAYAFSSTASKTRIRLPLAFHNTGAAALVVTDFRLALDGDPGRSHFDWETTRDRLRPESQDEPRYPTPFAVEGPAVREVIVEFGVEAEWTPEPASHHSMRVQAMIHPSHEWTGVGGIDWWAPADGADTVAYIAHRNIPPTLDPSEASTPATRAPR